MVDFEDKCELHGAGECTPYPSGAHPHECYARCVRAFEHVRRIAEANRPEILRARQDIDALKRELHDAREELSAARRTSELHKTTANAYRDCVVLLASTPTPVGVTIR